MNVQTEIDPELREMPPEDAPRTSAERYFRQQNSQKAAERLRRLKLRRQTRAEREDTVYETDAQRVVDALIGNKMQFKSRFKFKPGGTEEKEAGAED